MLCSVCLLGIVLCSAAPTGQVAYVSGLDQAHQVVCVQDLATGTVTRVGPGHCDGPPVWSPTGKWLAFESEQGDGTAIYVVKPDGSGLRPLNHANPWNTQPSWSPDGTRLAYASGIGPESRVMVYDLESNTETPWGGAVKGLMRPVWMNSGSIAAVGLIRLPQHKDRLSVDLFGVTAEGVYKLPPSATRYFEWAVEPTANGRRIAYESNDGGDREIFFFGLTFAKRGVTDVSNNRAADWNPVWSPDGKWLAFESFRSGRRGIYRSFIETSRVDPVAASKDYNNWAPAWSPDGRWFAFTSDRSGRPGVYICDFYGRHVRRVSASDVSAGGPAWRPTPR